MSSMQLALPVVKGLANDWSQSNVLPSVVFVSFQVQVGLAICGVRQWSSAVGSVARADLSPDVVDFYYCGQISTVSRSLQRRTGILPPRISAGGQGIGDGDNDQNALPSSGTKKRTKKDNQRNNGVRRLVRPPQRGEAEEYNLQGQGNHDGERKTEKTNPE
ncbi:unnamed protein product [Citrullus colocynthis]|uniref:Uncharacterized protein n=1 Tax=Citrullus colocynthis TaxID=252529 RepID=A0ABP0YXQ9_9ROSI